jgi:hypothetical protein
VGGIGGSNMPAIAVAAGAMHTCALLADGAVKCWGDDNQFQLADPSGADRKYPIAVAGLSGVAAITAGADHTCALRNNGEVWCWGGNVKGQLDDRTTTAHAAQPSSRHRWDVPGGHRPARRRLPRAGWARRSPPRSGWGWRRRRSETAPRPIAEPDRAPISDVKSVSAGGNHTCALLASGQARCWGDNASGTVGDGTSGNDRSANIKTTPTPVSGLANARLLSAGYLHTCAVLADGTARCWGNNWAGQLGDGNVTSRALPTATNAVLLRIRGERAPDRPACTTRGLTSQRSGMLGYNLYGQLGDGTTVNRRPQCQWQPLARSPVRGAPCVPCCPAAPPVLGVYYGQLGDGTTVSKARRPASAIDQRRQAHGSGYTLRTAAGGSIRCWGYGNHGGSATTR